MTGWLKRPRAQSRDPATRRQAVAADPLDELGTPLEEFVRNDTDPAVREAALRRAASLELAAERMREDADEAVREAAAELHRQLLAGTHPQAPGLAERLSLLGGIDEPRLLEHLATSADAVTLREAALRKLARPALTVQRILQDPDRELRLRLLAEIDDAPTLERIAARSRRQDRQLHRAAEARLHAMRVDAGDPDAIRQEAETLCGELEALPSGEDRERVLREVGAAWERIRERVDPALGIRFEHARAQLEAASRAPVVSDTEESVEDTWAASSLPRMDEPEHASAPVPEASADVQQALAEQRFRASLAATGAEPVATPEPATTTPARPAGKSVNALLRETAAALAAGNLGDADTRMQELLRRQAEITAAHGAQWQEVRTRFGELQRWQQWSTRRQRRQLCVDARAMRTATLTPEAIANRIRDLRKSWSELDRLEPASTRAHGLNLTLQRRFHAYCERALAPTRAWFAARDAARAEQAGRMRALLARPAPAADDLRGMAQRRNELAAMRRELDQAPPRERKSLARALNAAIAAIDGPLQARYEEVSAGHERLIARAQALLEADPRERIRQARTLQDEWKALGPGRQHLDRRQWRNFRAAIDAVFAEREREENARRQERKDQREQVERFLEETGAALTAADEAGGLQARLREAREGWRRLGVRDKPLAERFDRMRETAERRARELAARAARDEYRARLDAATASADDPALPPAWREAATAGRSARADATDLRRILVALETLGNQPSPDADQDLRMAANLARLQASLGGRGKLAPRDELDGLLRDWLAAGGPAADGATGTRFDAALDAALERIL